MYFFFLKHNRYTQHAVVLVFDYTYCAINAERRIKKKKKEEKRKDLFRLGAVKWYAIKMCR